jgi:uncharacterized protein YjiS (DUF1127 family)
MSFQSRIASSEPFADLSSPRPSLLQRAVFTLAVWRQRVQMRRSLANMDARSLRDAGISPAAAAFESGKPFWRPMGSLR